MDGALLRQLCAGTRGLRKNTSTPSTEAEASALKSNFARSRRTSGSALLAPATDAALAPELDVLREIGSGGHRKKGATLWEKHGTTARRQRHPSTAAERGDGRASAATKSDPPPPPPPAQAVMLSFTETLGDRLGRAVERAVGRRLAGGETETLEDRSCKPTPIQEKATPRMMSGAEVISVAPTGSGKTLAYGAAIAWRALQGASKGADNLSRRSPAAVIVSPTRELAEQIHRVMVRLSALASMASIMRVKALIDKAHVSGLAGRGGLSTCDVLVATPLRLVSALENDSVTLEHTEDLVLDEADQLFDERFLEQTNSILAAAKTSRKHLFSATLLPPVEAAARKVLLNPVKIVVAAKMYGDGASVAVDSLTIEQHFTFVGGKGEQGKVMAFRQLLTEGLMPPVLVFVQTQDRASQLLKELRSDGVSVGVIHAGLSDRSRREAVQGFRTGRLWILITTDLLARGMDFRSVNTVLNYDLPSSTSAYVHRIGRTGRAGRRGRAVTFFTEEDKLMLRRIANIAAASGAVVPPWMFQLPASGRSKTKSLERYGVKRRAIGDPTPFGENDDYGQHRTNFKRRREKLNISADREQE